MIIPKVIFLRKKGGTLGGPYGSLDRTGAAQPPPSCPPRCFANVSKCHLYLTHLVCL